MDNYLEKIQNFNRDKNVMRLQRMFDNSSILEIVGIERKETRHSRFLQWLFLEPELNTKSQYSPITHLLDIIVRRFNDQNQLFTSRSNNMDEVFRNNIITRNSSIIVERARREYETKGLTFRDKKGNFKSGLIDIYIKAYDSKSKKHIHICIENKLFTNEHDNQTKKYYAYMIGDKGEFNQTSESDFKFDANNYTCPTAEGDIILFVFLTPLSEYMMTDREIIENLCGCEKYIHINYQDIVYEILEPIIEDISTPQSAREKIEQYICSLGIPSGSYNSNDDNSSDESNNNDDDNTITKTIMATNSEMLNLAKSIYENHEELITNSISSNKVDEKKLNNYKRFVESHRDFLENMLFLLRHSKINRNDFYNLEFLILRLNNKTKNYLVQINNEYHILTKRGFAKEYVKQYCKSNREKLKNLSDLDKISSALNKDFKQIKGEKSTLSIFKSPSQHNKLDDKNKNKYERLFDSKEEEELLKDIYFNNNMWNDRYLKKLEVFIVADNSTQFLILKH